MSFPARGMWIKIDADRELGRHGVSFPARGMWIKIVYYNITFICI